LERGAASARIDPVVSDDEPDVMVEAAAGQRDAYRRVSEETRRGSMHRAEALTGSERLMPPDKVRSIKR
jgi:hypothetical protein